MNLPPDEHLPEVVPDTSPQAVSSIESQYKQRGYDERDKYVVQYDNTPKIPSETSYVQDHQGNAQYPVSVASPDGSLPWEPMSAVEETPAGHAGVGAMGGGGGGDASHDGMNNEKPEHNSRICGFKRKTFFIVIIAALVVIAIGVGGGVGGGLAAANSRQSSDSPDESSTSAISTAPTKTQHSSSTKTSSSSTSSPSPTFLNNQTSTYPFAFQGFTEENFNGNYTDIIRAEGFHDLGLDCLSYVWMPNNTDCCVTFCANKTASVGYHCDTYRRKKASATFPRIYIWCGEDATTSQATDTCSPP